MHSENLLHFYLALWHTDIQYIIFVDSHSLNTVKIRIESGEKNEFGGKTENEKRNERKRWEKMP